MAYSDPSKTVSLGSGELDDLAQTIATLTRGMVTIEDMSARVLAYSRSSDEADELRRQSILGRSGPPAYLRLLNEWGVYDQLKTPDNVIEIEEHPESHVKRRLAVGVFAGTTQLAIIWVQQGHDDFPPHARQALLGAARLTADQLTRPAGEVRSASDTLADLLTGRSTASPIQGKLAARPCVVAAFGLVDEGDDPAATRLALASLAKVVEVHAAAARRTSLVTEIDGTVYALLPGAASADELQPILAQAVEPATRATFGTVVESVADAPQSRATADLALPFATPGRLHSFDELRPALVVDEARKALSDKGFLLNAALAKASPTLTQTLLLYLQHGSDVGRTATALKIHQTTVRYRLRRIAELARLDLDDPDERLATELQLRLAGVGESGAR